jgi:hypothetical protein
MSDPFVDRRAPIEPCHWREDEDGSWWTGCKRGFVFSNAGPSENEFYFCCYCGKPLKFEPYAAPMEDDHDE